MNKLYKNPEQVPALNGAHSLVRVGEWNIKNKENKCIKYLACYTLTMKTGGREEGVSCKDGSGKV